MKVLKQIRLFWAVNLPGELRRRLADFAGGLRGRPGLEGARWVEEENLHLTVSFLGDTDINLINPMAEAVIKTAQGLNPFSLEIGAPGFFAGSGRGVLWAALKGDLVSMGELHRKVQVALAPLGFVQEKRPYRPHLTLARLKSPRDLNSLQSALGDLPGGSGQWRFSVNSVDLMESQLSKRGPAYTILASVALGISAKKS